MKSLIAWKNSVLGKTLDLDNQSFDCVDVSKHWIVYLSDKPWQQSAGWGDAKDIYYNWYGTYLDRIPRGNAPKLGDIVVMNGQVGGGYGHTGVVIGISGSNITIAQQNTFTQQPVYTGVFDAYTSYITGYLRPKVAFAVEDKPALQGYQRIVVSDGVNYREAPNTGAKIIKTFPGGDVLDFKGFVHGESVSGSNVWFVGRYTGGYAWSGGFTDAGTHDFPDLTPVSKFKPYQRQIAGDVMNYRTSPYVEPDNVIQQFQPGEVLDFDAWTRGMEVDGNNIWFRGRYTGGWIWSGGFTDKGTHDLEEVPAPAEPKPQPEPKPDQEPKYPAPSTDSSVLVIVNKKHPMNPLKFVPNDLVSVGNGQQLRKEASDALVLMKAAAAATGATLTPSSGYRSYETQQTLYANYVAQDGQEKADTYSARAGHSEHQTGLTMDFAPVAEAFADGKGYTWLIANGHKYGFVLRYPADKIAVTGYMFEPWHWRYVGVTVANDMHSKGIKTLEEYFNVPGGLYPDQEPSSPDLSDITSRLAILEQFKAWAEPTIKAIINFLDIIFKKWR